MYSLPQPEQTHVHCACALHCPPMESAMQRLPQGHDVRRIERLLCDSTTSVTVYTQLQFGSIVTHPFHRIPKCANMSDDDVVRPPRDPVHDLPAFDDEEILRGPKRRKRRAEPAATEAAIESDGCIAVVVRVGAASDNTLVNKIDFVFVYACSRFVEKS